VADISSPSNAVQTPHHHLWTDALHSRALAGEARNKWDRGTYVRWTIVTAWTVLEISCQDALNDPEISYRFKENTDEAVRRNGLTPLDWGAGVWQRVRTLQERRKTLMHRFLTESNLFPETSVAHEAIETVREGVVDIYRHAGRPAPHWIIENESRGWDAPQQVGSPTVCRVQADPNDPGSIRIVIVRDGHEYPVEVLPANTDPAPFVQDLLKKADVSIPFALVRIYLGSVLSKEIETRMRGAT